MTALQTACSVEGCDRQRKYRVYCNAHYQRVLKHGDPLPDVPLMRKPSTTPLSGLDLFKSFVVEDDQGCWNWIGPIQPNGYGRFNHQGKSHPAHRWAYEALVRPIPAGLVVDHLCRNRQCCRPAHLDIVTHKINLARGMSPQAIVTRTNLCKRGHELTEDNVYRQPSKPNIRFCRTCTNIRQRARRANR